MHRTRALTGMLPVGGMDQCLVAWTVTSPLISHACCFPCPRVKVPKAPELGAGDALPRPRLLAAVVLYGARAGIGCDATMRNKGMADTGLC